MDIDTDPKAALARYITELETNYLPWYERSSRRLQVLWGIGQMTAILAGIGTSVLAAMASERTFSDYAPLRLAIVLLPLLGTLASALLGQTRAKELLGLREQGREVIQRIVSQARADYASAANNSETSALHRALIAAVSDLERAQSLNFLNIAPGGSSTSNAERKPSSSEGILERGS